MSRHFSRFTHPITIFTEPSAFAFTLGPKKSHNQNASQPPEPHRLCGKCIAIPSRQTCQTRSARRPTPTNGSCLQSPVRIFESSSKTIPTDFLNFSSVLFLSSLFVSLCLCLPPLLLRNTLFLRQPMCMVTPTNEGTSPLRLLLSRLLSRLFFRLPLLLFTHVYLFIHSKKTIPATRFSSAATRSASAALQSKNQH